MKTIAYIVLLISMLSIVSGCNQELSSDEYLKSGVEYVNKKEWKSAIIEFKNAVKQTPENAQARALLGKTYLETQSANAAIKELTRAIEFGYDKSELSIPLGMAYRQAGESQSIIDDIVATDNQSATEKATINALRGVAFLQLENKVDAKEALETAKKQDGEATEVRFAWATYESINGNTEAQERWLQPLLERDGGVADAWSRMGQIEQRRNNIDAAEKAYSRAIEIRQIPHFDYVRRAMARIGLDNIAGAESDIDYLRKSGANWPMLAYAEGLIDFKAKRYDEAQIHFLETLSNTPGYSPSQLMVGISYFYQQNYQSAINFLEQYLNVDPDNARANLVYATSLLAIKKSAKALDVLQKLNIREPGNFRVLALLSQAYLKEGKSVESMETLQKAVQVDPDQATTRLQLGSSLIRNQETVALGQRELRKALELDPGLKKAKLALFMSYIRGKQYPQAMKTAQEIDQEDPKQSIGANLIGLTYLAQGKPEAAKQQLLKTLERFPVDILTSHNLARIYIQEKAYADARALYIKVIEKEPNHIQSLQQLTLISAREGNRSEMMQWLQKAADRNPTQTQPKLILASQYLQQGNPAEAAKVLNDVDVEDKESAGFIVLMARAKIGSGETDHALHMLNDLVKKQPDIAIAHFILAQAYSTKNDIEKMREALEQTVSLVPNHLKAQVTLAKLDLTEGKNKAFNTRLKMLQDNYPGNVEVELLKARQSSSKKDYDSAIKALSGLLDKAPQSDVVIELARNQWQSGDRQGAISGLELWSQENKDNRVLLLLAEYYLLENRNNEATATYASLEQAVPDNAQILNNLAWSLKDSNPSKGVEYAQKADQLVPGNPLIMDTLAMLLLKVGDNEKALEVIEEAVNKAPKVLDIQLNYADILVANDQKNRAKKVLNDTLQLMQDPNKKQSIDERLKNL